MMPFDRVLPKPLALHVDPSRTYGSSGSLLEHKIMNDNVPTSMAEKASPMNSIFQQYNRHDGLEPHKQYPPCLSSQIHSMNRDIVAKNETVSITLSTKESSSRMTGSISPRDQSVTPSAYKSDPDVQTRMQFCLCQPDPKIPRPRNAFILFRQHTQAVVAAQNPGLSNPEISKIIGQHWKSLPSEKKERWKLLAEKEKMRHQQQYPDYRYQPRRLGRDGTMKNAANTPLSVTPDGPAICSRCGGQLINIQDSPIIPSNLVSRSESDPNQAFSLQASHSSQLDLPSPKSRDAEHSSHVQGSYGTDNGHRVHQEFKRRRTSSRHVSKPRTQGSLSDVEMNRRAYSKSHVSRSGNTNPSYWGFPPTYSVPLRRVTDDEKDFCQRLTLPPLQTNLMAAVGSPRPDRTNNSSPILFKIKTLSKIAPALNIPRSDHKFPGRGAVIAVDGQHPGLVNTVVKSLGKLLLKDGKYTVNVFEGPNIKSQPGGGVNEYLQAIETWHRISKEIVQFVNTKSDREEPERIADSSSSGASLTPRLSVDSSKPCSSSVVSPDWSVARSVRDELENAPMAKANPPIPIALISQYQLTTADSFARGVQIRDRYNPVEHWQWMASLWRGCVGPDATIYIKDCGIEEIGQYGDGNNPVEDRLSDAKSLIIRRLADSSSDIEERALRRVGFEIEDWLTR